jgi:hypothetical protein
MDMRWLRWLLSGVVFLLAVIAVELAALLGPLEPRAAAQIPDSGLQRKQMLQGQDQTNLLLDSILQHLRTQTLKVRVVGTDKQSGTEGASMPSVVAPAPRVIRK